jgi:glycolate oxidase FAD binding subunit
MTLRPEDVRQLAEMVRDAHDQNLPLRIVGHGSWLDAGGPVDSRASRLEVESLCGIIEYVPGDLTLTARAGTSLAEIDGATAPHGQWCPILPWGDDSATLGAAIATAAPGPFVRALGRTRDIALGVEFVDGTGATVRAGGRVVKNVAGFDLTRLLVGSWGTLGVITEISVRLRARPAVDESWAVAFDWNDEAAMARLTAFERGPYAPLAICRLEKAEVESLGLSPAQTLLARLGGNRTLVTAARVALNVLGRADACEPAIWARYRNVHHATEPAGFGTALGHPLAQRVKKQFDPAGVLNRGMFSSRAA